MVVSLRMQSMGEYRTSPSRCVSTCVWRSRYSRPLTRWCLGAGAAVVHNGAMRVPVAAVLLLTGLLWAGRAAAQVYHWVDADGTVHYSTGLDSVPEAYRPSARLLSGASGPAAVTRISFTPGTSIRVSALIDGRGPVTLILHPGAGRTIISPAALARLGIP